MSGRLVPNVRRTLWGRMEETLDASRLLSRPHFLAVAARLCDLAARPPAFLPRPPPPPTPTGDEDDSDSYAAEWGRAVRRGRARAPRDCRDDSPVTAA